MFNKNKRKYCCFPGFFEEKATKTEVKYAFERIDQLEQLISSIDKTKRQSEQVSVIKKTKASRKKKKPSVSKSKVDVKVCSDGKNSTEMLIKLSCGCILKKSQPSQSTHVSSISSSSSAVKCTPPGNLNPSSEKDPHGFCVKNVIKFTDIPQNPVIHKESELKLILKNETVKVSKEQVFQEPNIIKSLSTCGCGLEECKMEWNFPCSNRNNTPTSDPSTVKSMFNAQKHLVDCGINTLDQYKEKEPMVERIKKKVAIYQDDGSISKNDESSVSPCTRQMCISTQTYDNSCREDSSIFESKEYRLHCGPSPMAACGKDRKNKRSVKCNPLRYNISHADLNRMSKPCIHPKKKPKKKKFKCCNRNKNKNKTCSLIAQETAEAHCEEPVLVSPQNTIRFMKKTLPKNTIIICKDMKTGPSEIEITQSDLPSCCTNLSEVSNDSYVCQETPKSRKKNTYIIQKVIKHPQQIVKFSKQHPAYLFVEPSKKRCREECVVQSSFQNLDDDCDSESTASGYTKCKI